MTKRIAILTLVLAATTLPNSLAAQDPAIESSNADDAVNEVAGLVMSLDWQDFFGDNELPDGLSIVEDDELGSVLKVDATGGDRPATLLATLHKPKISEHQYWLEGKIRYENVKEPGYLDMWNHFGDKEAYFTRTLAGSGPMAKIQGTSKWRAFVLPFHIGKDESRKPDKLVLNVVLPAGGTVYLTNLELKEGAMRLGAHDLHWSRPGIAGMIGGIIGAIFGIFGSVYGWSRESGKAWKVMKYFPTCCFVCGALCLCLCAWTASHAHLYEIAYVFGLMGFLLIVIPWGNEWYYRRLRQSANPKAEVRQMQAMDV